MPATTDTNITCGHCGDPCPDEQLQVAEVHFCCNGCMMVYKLLHEHDLQDYYRYTDTPGISPKESADGYEFLDDPQFTERLLDFSEGNMQKVTLHLPQIHCSSCLYLLERLHHFNNGITQSQVNFTTQKASILFRKDKITLRQLIVLLSKIGYAPRLNLDSWDKSEESTLDKKLLYKLGLAGFSFGNIMLLSFPEYLGFDKASYLFHIGYINILLATPVLFYSGWSYIKSAWKGLMMRHLNIDLPIALGMITLYGRSLFEILSHQGEGYLDSFAGFVFFLLIGRWFQSFTYQRLDFERNYKAYFPISAQVHNGTKWVSKALQDINIGDRVLIKNQQLIPADSVITKGKARVDYSFVTGESELISKNKGEVLYAGGRHNGANIEVTTSQKVDESYLTQLWNEDTFRKENQSQSSKLIDSISKHFTFVVLVIAVLTLISWYFIDASQMAQVFTAVLIVACPCALALSIPFTYGNIVRLLSMHGLYLKNTETIEQVQDISHIIFDKTGTITDNSQITLHFSGDALTDDEKIWIKSICHHSSHPLSVAICKHLAQTPIMDVDRFEENIGLGISAICQNKHIKIGSSSFIFDTDKVKKEKGVLIEINGQYRGIFKFDHALRKGIQEIISGLKSQYSLALLSGDSDAEFHRMRDLFGGEVDLHFNQTPKDKLLKIKSLQDQGAKVMMIGDGLNDAGALKQSNVGIVISDQHNNFSPACDGILRANHFHMLQSQINYLRRAKYIIYGAFVMAFLYNAIGLSFAITGHLSPVVAAILMPVSSISVILYGVTVSYLYYRWSINKSMASHSTSTIQ